MPDHASVTNELLNPVYADAGFRKTRSSEDRFVIAIGELDCAPFWDGLRGLALEALPGSAGWILVHTGLGDLVSAYLMRHGVRAVAGASERLPDWCCIHAGAAGEAEAALDDHYAGRENKWEVSLRVIPYLLTFTRDNYVRN